MTYCRKHVIHTVGPIYDEDEDEQCAEELGSCYAKSLKLAIQNGLKQIVSIPPPSASFQKSTYLGVTALDLCRHSRQYPQGYTAIR